MRKNEDRPGLSHTGGMLAKCKPTGRQGHPAATIAGLHTNGAKFAHAEAPELC